MSDGKIENTVNKLVSFVCENVKKNNWTSIRDSVSYLTDFQLNKRCTQYSIIKYDYEFKKSIKLTDTEKIMIKESLIKYLDKFTYENFVDIVINNTNIGVSCIIISFDNAFSKNDINKLINDIETDVSNNYGGNLFTIVNNYLDLFPQCDLVSNLKVLEKLVVDGTYLTNKNNIEVLSLTQLRSLIWDNSSKNCFKNITNEDNFDGPAEPGEPGYPCEPSEPSEPSYSNIYLNNKNPKINEEDIREAICKILEITTTEKTTTVGN